MASRENAMKRILPLIAAPQGIPLRVVNVDIRGRGPSRRLLEIGIIPGTIIRIVTKTTGPIIIEVRGSLFAIGKGHARRIYVEVI